MTVTMLYFDTISKLINKYGYSWRDVENIQDHDGRVRRTYIWDGQEKSYTESLRHAFYFTHMGRAFDENQEGDKAVVKAFLEALEEAKEASKAVSA